MYGVILKSKSISHFEQSRVETFSDGVFAIIVTLLVLEIKVPHINNFRDSGELLKALESLIPKVISWIISFFTVCVIWVNHHRLLKQFRIFTHGLFWWNALLLLFVSFIPFPTALLGDYPNNQVAVILYGVVLSVMALIFSLLRFYTLNKKVILKESVSIENYKKGTIYSLIYGPLLYLMGALFSFIHPNISFIIYLLIPIYFIMPHSTEDMRVDEEL